MKKRLLAIVMTMAMALSLLPVTALADGADIGSQPAGQVQEDPDLGNTGGGGDDPLPGDGPDEGDDPTLPGDGPDEGNDPTLPGDGPDEGNDPSLPGDGPDAGDDPSVEGVLTAAASDAIAAIGNAEYTTLEEFANALKGIESETKVELLSDLVNHNYDKVVDLSLPSNVTLEGNNNTIEGNIKVTVQKDASNVTIQNVMFKDIHNNVDVGSGGNYGFNNKTGNLTAIYGSGLTGTFTITGCTFENVDWDAIQITPLAGANITITDNIFRTDAECQTVRFIHVESAQNTDFSICATRNKFFGVEALNQTGLEVYYPVNADKVNLSGNYMDAPMAVCIGTGGTSYNNAWQKACPFKDENLEEDIMPIAMREVSAGNRLYLTEDEVAADGVKVLAGENCYDTISAAISAASGSSIQVKLLNDLKEDITIPEGKTLTLDLNGQTLTNASSHTIVNQGTLTILDSAGGGVVDVVTHGKAALYNKGAIPEISGGTFTRSKEAGTTEGGKGNSWYTVYNAGTIEKITGGTFENSGTFSSMLVNGWNNPGPAVQGYIGTISGGTFTGGSITIKNDDGGKIDKICGDAVITNETQTAIQNTSTIGEISGGTISGGGRAIYNSSWKDGAEEYIGTITIKDGAVIKGGINNTNWGGSSNTVTQFAKTTIEGGKISGSLTDDGLSTSGCQIVISGGYFTADPTSYLVSGKDAVASNQDGYQYMVGTLALSQQTLALTKGGEAVLSVNAEPWGAVPASAVSWSSDNEAVAAVDNGTVTAAAPGTATITAEVNGKSLTCSVTVSYAGVDGISLDRSALTLVSGGSTALTATVSPSNADQTVTWTSSDEAVATVAQDGTVTAMAAGEAIITASAGAYRASCTVTVTGADVDVLPSTEPTETEDQLPDGLNDEVKEAVNEAAGTVNADSALSQAAQEQAGQLADSAEKDELLQKGQSELGSEEIVLYTQTYLQVTTVDALTGTDGSINSVTLDISPKGQVVASTASTAGDINQGNSVVVKEIPQEDLNITGTAHVALTLPDDFASKTIYIKHQASNGRTYFYTAEADEGANLTFSTRHGFSPFTFSLTNEATAQVEDVGYADLQDAIDAVADGGTITVLKDGLGTVTIQGSKTFTLVKGEDVDTLPTLVAASGYRLTDHGNGSYTISRRSSGGGSSGSATYTVSVDSSRHGDVTVSPKSASKGTTVTITVKPDDGYELDELTVTDKDGDSIKLKDKGDGRFTFTMPASKVTVEAVFTALEQEEEQPLFSDVAEDDWYYDAVAYVAENGIMSGTDGSRFSPNGTLTRAMLSQILYAMEDKPAVSGAATFSDVAAGAWYADAVNWTAAQGIVAGMGENSFAPDAPVTREQLSLILYGYARYKGYDTSASVSLSGYADRDSVAVWAADSMGWAVSEGLISGRPGGYLDPAGTATRAEVAQILMNFCEDLAR